MITPYLTQDGLIRWLEKRQGTRNNKEFAESLGLSGAYLGDIYAKKREPGPKVLRAIKVKRHIMYEVLDEVTPYGNR